MPSIVIKVITTKTGVISTMGMTKLPLKIAAIIALSSTLLAACDDARVRVSADTGPRYHSGHGGYASHTPHNHRVSYSPDLGLYVVAGLLNTYWNGSNYYRYHNHGWQRSSDYRRWNNVGVTYIPSKLHRRHYRPGRGKNGRRHRGRRYRQY